ncbi:MAG: hypothetical protein M1816_004500 [Peltula sp. TS41687]|nr:MAG: hypothetical protein M1816_004500 [Peltula sp. TS41687]
MDELVRSAKLSYGAYEYRGVNSKASRLLGGTFRSSHLLGLFAREILRALVRSNHNVHMPRAMRARALLDRVEEDPIGKNRLVCTIRRTVNRLCAENGQPTVQRERDYITSLCQAVAAHLDCREMFHLLGPRSRMLGDLPEVDDDRDLLAAATYVGNHSIVRELLHQSVDVNPGSQVFGYALKNAAKRGDEQMVQLLLAHGSDVNDEGGQDGTVLTIAASTGHEGIIRLLLDSSYKLSTSDDYYRLAIGKAARGGHEGVVRLLLDCGTHEDLPKLQYRILCEAAAHGHENVVRMMLQLGVPVNPQRHEPETPLVSAASGGHASMIRLLLKEGADGSVICRPRYEPLTYAAKNGHVEATQTLLENGANINGGRNIPPLVVAAEDGQADMMRFLLAREADIDAQGGRALRAASTMGAASAVRLLLEHGVDPNRWENNSISMHCAMANEQHHVVRILLAYGAKRIEPSDPGYAENFADGQHPIPPLLPPTPWYDIEYPWANY